MVFYPAIKFFQLTIIMKTFIRSLCFLMLLPLLTLAQKTAPENKVKHADPVFEDLTGDLGADKGDNEININLGYRNLEGLHHTLLTQLEFEYVPVKNLGIELLIPYTAYFTNPVPENPRPGNSLEFLQWTMQYTLFQSFKRNISLAVGLENAFQSQDPYSSPQENKRGFSVENIRYLPFLIIAKNWDDKFFLLFKGGSGVDHNLEDNSFDEIHRLTTAIHYKIPGENENYLGVELNKSVEEGDFEMFIRPQVKFEITDNFNIGTAVGFPVSKPDTKWSAFMRVAYEL